MSAKLPIEILQFKEAQWSGNHHAFEGSLDREKIIGTLEVPKARWSLLAILIILGVLLWFR